MPTKVEHRSLSVPAVSFDWSQFCLNDGLSIFAQQAASLAQAVPLVLAVPHAGSLQPSEHDDERVRQAAHSAEGSGHLVKHAVSPQAHALKHAVYVPHGPAYVPAFQSGP